MDVTDFVSLLPLLRERSDVLHLEPLEGVERGESWHASLLLAEGKIATCFVRGKISDRVLQRGVQAISWLADAGAPDGLSVALNLCRRGIWSLLHLESLPYLR